MGFTMHWCMRQDDLIGDVTIVIACLDNMYLQLGRLLDAKHLISMV